MLSMTTKARERKARAKAKKLGHFINKGRQHIMFLKDCPVDYDSDDNPIWGYELHDMYNWESGYGWDNLRDHQYSLDELETLLDRGNI